MKYVFTDGQQLEVAVTLPSVLDSLLFMTLFGRVFEKMGCPIAISEEEEGAKLIVFDQDMKQTNFYLRKC